jgi:uncharacterized protein (TIGR03083 family)
MSSTVAAGSEKSPRTSDLDEDLAGRLAATEYERVVMTLEGLSPEHWSRQTVCDGWDVRAMAGHVLGMTQMAASVRETLRQQLVATRRSKRSGRSMLDELTALQVDEQARHSHQEIVDRMRTLGPKAARGRSRAPAFIRRRNAGPQDVGGQQESWTFGYVLETILTRDPFMHRLALAEATGVLVPPSAEHEGAIVDNVVREWAERHGSPYTLVLTGPAGGRWSHGSDGESITMDAFDFCRAVSGRGAAPGLLSQQVPF